MNSLIIVLPLVSLNLWISGNIIARRHYKYAIESFVLMFLMFAPLFFVRQSGNDRFLYWFAPACTVVQLGYYFWRKRHPIPDELVPPDPNEGSGVKDA